MGKYIEAVYKVSKVFYLDDEANIPEIVEELEKTGGNVQIANKDKLNIEDEEFMYFNNNQYVEAHENMGQPSTVLYDDGVMIWNNASNKEKKEEE